MHFRGLRVSAGVALTAAALLGVASPAVAVKPGPTEAVTAGTELSVWMPQEVWGVIAGYLPPDIQTLIRMREISVIHRNAVDGYLTHNPRIWRQMPTATLERILASPDVPQAWKTAITTTVLIPDVMPAQGNRRLDWVADQSPAARVIQDQQELDVALAQGREVKDPVGLSRPVGLRGCRC